MLGRIPADTRFGKTMQADLNAATKAIETIAKQAAITSVEEAAQGIINIANEHMAQALRVISLERGIDPREFVLAAFGGAGGLHVCELAESLGVNTALVPAAAGVLSALGMLVAEPGRQLTQTVGQLLDELSDEQINTISQQLINEGKLKLSLEGHDESQMISLVSLQCCYKGQAHTLNIAWHSITSAKDQFEKAYQARYGHQLDNAIELVNISVGVMLDKVFTLPDISFNQNTEQDQSNRDNILREDLSIDKVISGPVSISEDWATIWVADGWSATLDQSGHMLLKKI